MCTCFLVTVSAAKDPIPEEDEEEEHHGEKAFSIVLVLVYRLCLIAYWVSVLTVSWQVSDWASHRLGPV